MKAISNFLKNGIRISLILSVLCLSGTAFAINSNALHSSTANSSLETVGSKDHFYRSRDDSYDSVLQPLRHAQSNRSSKNLRSKSEVMQEVKQRYNGKVVKISLNERTYMYNVRVLLPSGKVKNLSISAQK